MAVTLKPKDQEILAKLKKPIADLVDHFYSERDSYQKIRFRQLAWQAVDVLARTGNVDDLENQKDIRRIILDVQKAGGSGEFIKRSLSLALSIYQKLQLDHPALLKRYQGRYSS